MVRIISSPVTSSLLSFCFVVALLTCGKTSLAQFIDSNPPSIEFEPIEQGTLGDTQVFSVSVSDDVGVETVTLYYRTKTTSPYNEVTMQQLGTTGLYSVKLANQDLGSNANVIQYYIQALDGAGNRALDGFAFDPFERQLVAAAAVVEEPPTDVIGSLSTSRKFVYGALGVVVIGALLSASSGGGGGAAQVPVTISVAPLP